jgi:predicted PurR-regulated permease PerM
MSNSPSNATPRPRPTPTARLLRLALGGATAIFLLWVLGHVLLLVFASILLAVALHGGTAPMSRLTGWPHFLCLGLIVVSVLAVLGGAVYFGGSRLAEQSSQLWDQLLTTAATGAEWLRQYEWGRAVVDGNTAEDIAENGGQLLRGVGSVVVSLVGVMAGLLIAMVAALYFAISPQLYIDGFLRLLPKARRHRAAEILTAIGQSLRYWLLAQGVAMLLIMVTSFIGLMIIGVPMASLLALIAGITNFVPYIGPIIGFVPALLVALGNSPEMALWVTVLFAGIQFLEGNIIEPIVQRRITHLPPVLTILSQTVMGTLFGVLGVVLATPMLAAGLIGVRMWYVEDVLGDRKDKEA